MTTLIVAPVGLLWMFSIFQPYDDEGYFLVSLRDYIGGHGDYSQIYGPFFYEVMGGTFRILGLDVSTDNGRLVTLVLWVLASLIGGIAVLGLTRNLWLAAAGQLLTFHALSALTSEPMHPEGLIGVLLVSLAALAAYRSRAPRASTLLIGSLVAAITLVKVNVGAFAVLALALALAATLGGRARRVVLPAMIVAFVAAPFLVTAGLLGLEWVQELALVIGLSAAAVCIAGLAAGTPNISRSDGARMLAGGAALMIVCLGIAAVRGMRLSDVVNSVAGAQRLAQLFVLPAQVGIPNVVWAALSLVAAGGLLLRRLGAQASAAIPAFMRIAAGAFTLLSVLLLPRWFFLLAVPLAWVAVLPPPGDHENPTDPFARLLLAALAVTEILYAYPVAGSQQWLAALTLGPVGAITLNDGLRQLQAWAAARQSRSFLKVAASLAPGALIVNLAVWALIAYLIATVYVSGRPPGLPGTALMRLPPAQASDLRLLARAIDQSCANFITMPRMPSLYLWTGREGLPQLNAGIWMFSLDASQQQAIVSEIQDQPRLCVVRSKAVIDFEAEGRTIPQRPLVEYINAAFEPAATYGIYELLVRKPQ